MEIAKTMKKEKERTVIFGRLNAATRRAVFSVVILIALFVLFAVLQPDKFLDSRNLQNLLQQIVTYTIIGCGLTFCLVCGGNDLSAGASMALSGIIMVRLLIAGLPLWVCIILCLMMGIMTGIMNGFFIEILGVVPFVATLATQWVYRGMANVLVNGAPVYTTNIPSESVQKQFYILGGGRMGGDGLPYSVIITLVYAVILGIVLAKSRIGRQIYACGSNLEAAKLSGINAVKTRMFAYCISGLSAAICGILVASRLSSAQPTAGNGYEMEAIAASVLGGISILGGEGTILNTIIGALMMGVIRNGLNLNGVNSFWQQVIVGLILLVAVASQTANRGGNIDNIKRKMMVWFKARTAALKKRIQNRNMFQKKVPRKRNV
ncbi:MAG: ABC transporter permease [Lachnospiraceae bacterium]|nr:ABC transporter permease [Lachnospiraceae bacterium]